MFGSRPPKKSRRGRFWEWWNPGLGKSIVGWLAGPIVGLDTHYLGRTQPCRASVTGKRMKCFCQNGNLASVWRGYVPVWNEDGVKGFTVIGERAYDLAAQINMFSPIAITRERWAGQPIMVRESDWTKGPPPFLSGKLKTLDIRPALLQLWGDKELTKFIEDHPELRDDQVVELAHAADDVPAPVAQRSPMRPAKNQPGTLGEVMDSLPLLNGKGKH